MKERWPRANTSRAASSRPSRSGAAGSPASRCKALGASRVAQRVAPTLLFLARPQRLGRQSAHACGEPAPAVRPGAIRVCGRRHSRVAFRWLRNHAGHRTCRSGFAPSRPRGFTAGHSRQVSRSAWHGEPGELRRHRHRARRILDRPPEGQGSALAQDRPYLSGHTTMAGRARPRPALHRGQVKRALITPISLPAPDPIPRPSTSESPPDDARSTSRCV